LNLNPKLDGIKFSTGGSHISGSHASQNTTRHWQQDGLHTPFELSGTHRTRYGSTNQGDNPTSKDQRLRLKLIPQVQQLYKEVDNIKPSDNYIFKNTQEDVQTPSPYDIERWVRIARQRIEDSINSRNIKSSTVTDQFISSFKQSMAEKTSLFPTQTPTQKPKRQKQTHPKQTT
jgi:hypothetical protein